MEKGSTSSFLQSADVSKSDSGENSLVERSQPKETHYTLCPQTDAVYLQKSLKNIKYVQNK